MFRKIVRTTIVISAVMFIVAGCSSKKVDSSSVEKDVVRVVKNAFPSVPNITADCPGDVKAEKGKKFTCKLGIGGKSTSVKINITNVKDKQFFFKPEFTQAVIPAEAQAKEFVKQAGKGSKADCGKDKVLIKNPGETFSCKLTANGRTQELKFRVKDTQGNFEQVK